ncbi:hypothetical protein [Nostoc sp. FACHB-145]|uniref:hypothetical protein n=1 Tax=Nostoc sp. FACHB-145 TaxID=2692836 RepID=UPI0016874DEB|nr:hypothetical protein [Nostoc sp. FACHB-145]MBD2472599.1 hypothetical protein [Nostoc sp. FACHB-145]
MSSYLTEDNLELGTITTSSPTQNCSVGRAGGVGVAGVAGVAGEVKRDRVAGEAGVAGGGWKAVSPPASPAPLPLCPSAPLNA